MSMLTEQLLTVCGGCYVNAGFTTSLLCVVATISMLTEQLLTMCVMAAMSMLTEQLLTVCGDWYVNVD